MNTKHTFISRSGSLTLIGLAVLAQLMTAAVAHAASVTLNWSFNYTVDPVCTTTVTKNCVTGFEYGTTPDGGTTLVKIGVAPNPATTAATRYQRQCAIHARSAVRCRGLLRAHHGTRFQRQRNLLRRRRRSLRANHAGIAIQFGNHGKVVRFTQPVQGCVSNGFRRGTPCRARLRQA
jgi:hypothetical protein